MREVWQDLPLILPKGHSGWYLNVFLFHSCEVEGVTGKKGAACDGGRGAAMVHEERLGPGKKSLQALVKGLYQIS